ncbi:MAG: CNP1-like family protein [Sulfuritalea sp.]|nr:CNP1-like family protein [Sulfuritalea sp.]
MGLPRFNSNFEEEAPWQEQKEVDLPAFPKEENLREIYVSAVATNKYLIDAGTLAVGADGVVRYVLVVKTSGGATNVSFEGINCKDRSWKLYATGRSDNSWNRSQASRAQWRPIENKPVNRHHAALSRDYFCPGGIGIYTADEGRNALRLGKHPNSL